MGETTTLFRAHVPEIPHPLIPAGDDGTVGDVINNQSSCSLGCECRLLRLRLVVVVSSREFLCQMQLGDEITMDPKNMKYIIQTEKIV